MSGAGDIDHIEVVFLDHPVQMDVDEILSRGGSPVAEQHVLDVRECEWPLEQRIAEKINLRDRKVVCGTPIGVGVMQQFRGKCVGLHDISSFVCA